MGTGACPHACGPAMPHFSRQAFSEIPAVQLETARCLISVLPTVGLSIKIYFYQNHTEKVSPTGNKLLAFTSLHEQCKYIHLVCKPSSHEISILAPHPFNNTMFFTASRDKGQRDAIVLQ